MKELLDRWYNQAGQIAPVRIRGLDRKRLVLYFSEYGLLKGAEIGVDRGHFSEYMLKYVSDCTLLCVDPWRWKLRGQSRYESTVRRLAPYGERIVQKRGILFENGIYWAVELANHIGRRVQLRRDLGDVGVLYVFDLEMRFICVALDSELQGISPEEAKEARRLQKERLRREVKALKVLSQDKEDHMLRLIKSKKEQSGQVCAVHTEEEFESETTREAAKSVVERAVQKMRKRVLRILR